MKNLIADFVKFSCIFAKFGMEAGHHAMPMLSFEFFQKFLNFLRL